MALVILRDDDLNATTDPARVEAAYAPLLELGLTLSLSIIPEVALDVRAPDGRRERFLHPDWPCIAAHARLHADSDAARWVRGNRTQLAALQHGHTHARVRGGTELGSLTYAEADARVRAGKTVLEEALGETPEAFVAPWDRLSRGAMDAATASYACVSTSWVDRTMLPVSRWGAHFRERLTRRQVLRHEAGCIVRHNGGWMGPSTDPDDVPRFLARDTATADVTVIVLHHWMFWDGAEPHPAIRSLARALARHTVVRPRDVYAAIAA